MNAILREGIKENMIQNIRLYSELYPIQTTMDGCAPTEDACNSVAKYIECEYQNLGENEKCDFAEFKNLCIETAFSELDLCDSSNDESGDTLKYLIEMVDAYLNGRKK